jgi:hypothetical protein
MPWLDRMEAALAEPPSREDACIERMLGEVDKCSFRARDYDLSA